MKIVATVAVKDEVELVERCVRHLQRIGVSHVYVFDLYSTDGTAQILQRLAAGPGITVGNFSDEDPVAYKATVQGQIETLRHSGADWAIFLDADEFWIPASGDLRDCAALADHDVLTVRRFNVPLGPDGPLCAPDLGPAHYADLQFFARDIPRFRVAMQRDADLSWIRGVPKYKAMARPAVMDGIGEGLHDVVSHSQVRRTTPQDLLIAHLPFTSFSRFQRKHANIGDYFRKRTSAAYQGQVEPLRAWHWQRWNRLSGEAAVRAEFERQHCSREEIDALRQAGVIRSARTMFEQGLVVSGG